MSRFPICGEMDIQLIGGGIREYLNRMHCQLLTAHNFRNFDGVTAHHTDAVWYPGLIGSIFSNGDAARGFASRPNVGGVALGGAERYPTFNYFRRQVWPR